MSGGKLVQEFYNKHIFPNYDLTRFSNKDDLKNVASSFAKVLDRSIPSTASVIDVGTGTGQMSAFLSMRRKKVFGIDFSETSLAKAKALKKKLKLNSFTLENIDLLDTKAIEKLGKFDYVLCLGVLHHLSDPYLGFQNILKLLKPKGHLVIGLYNKFGRIPLKIRKGLAKTIFKYNRSVKEKYIKIQIGDLSDKERTKGWWEDQYAHPLESTHTVGEVMNWFKQNNIEFVQSVPTLSFFDTNDIISAGVWNDERKKPTLIRLCIKQISWVWKTQHEGGYWMMFGKKQ